jgi:PAS domain S-box-containing protein
MKPHHMAPKTNIDYKNIFEEFPSAIVVLDKLGKIINVNNRLFEWLGYKPEDVIGKRITTLPYIPKKAKTIVLKKFALRVLGKHITPYDLEFTHKDGTPQIGRISGKLIKDPNTGKQLDLIHIENISKEQGFKRALNLQQENTATLFATLANYALELSKEQPLEDTFQNAITLLGKALNFDRVYIFEDSKENNTTSNTYEWAAEGISAEKNNLQNLSYEKDIPGFKELLEQDSIINGSSIEHLPSAVKKILESQKIKSVLIIPLKNNSSTYGFIGFDSVKEQRIWTEEEVHLLEILGQLTTQRFEREASSTLLTEKLSELKTMNQLMVGRELRMAELKKKLETIEE